MVDAYAWIEKYVRAMAGYIFKGPSVTILFTLVNVDTPRGIL